MAIRERIKERQGWLHGLLSVLAAGLFLVAGFVGYDSLMQGAGTDLRRATVVTNQVLSADGKPVASEAQSAHVSGYHVEVIVGFGKSGRPEPGGFIRLRPSVSTLAEARELAAAFPPGTTLQVLPNVSDPAEFEIADSRIPSPVIFPALLCTLGVLSLALSLRFGPDRLLRQKPASSPAPNTAHSLDDVLEPRA